MPHTTRTLGAPKKWDEEKDGPCLGLPITDSEGVMLSFWKPSWKERVALITGKPVRLAVHSSGHPPVWLDVQP